MSEKPPFLPEYRVASKGIAAVINAEGQGPHIDNKRTVLRSMDGEWQFIMPAAFAGFVGKDENCILSITLIKNELEAAPIVGTPKIIKP